MPQCERTAHGRDRCTNDGDVIRVGPVRAILCEEHHLELDRDDRLPERLETIRSKALSEANAVMLLWLTT